MEIRHVRYFLAIVDTGSFTRAASELGIAQPALSQALNRMEKELGVRLFDRSRRGATLTAAGLAMVDDLRLSLARLDAAAHRAGEIGAQRAGRLTIGFVSAALFDTLPRAIRALRENTPDVELVMREMSNAEQAIALERGEIDIGLLHTPVAVNGRMREQLIRRDPLVAVLPKDFRRQPDGTVTLQDLAGTGLVWFPHDQLPLIRAGILSAFRQAGHPVDIVLDVNRTLTVISCVAAGCGVSLLPRSIHTFAFEGVAYSTIRDGGALPLFELSAIWPARSRPTLADRFAALLPSADVQR
ncbi:TPA: LysR family transcriptional regulator [Burkholderia cepacia]|uniref:LysR family transcriptional regulator n=1 Tax=Burkholderia cepacia TaxID=292 RepID=A0AAQ0JGI3_BURCE|nr:MULTISPECIES: LysR family transcriptional regulator [Burkholderia]HDR9760477.1 LysR family transcriptional regulator [Burkholderia cepacia ATCC 25416]KML06727.1 LysR family transcriptional regulator [Burkholderia cepacia]KML39071.1 LysR family transcriptional regulator [Burkholderia lata]KMN47463.1 LysR family transcriptional regulator [Burkholderia sp. LK4]KVH77278.1 LysR family transcriptional regulator [Burkholderia cepacia]